MKAAKSMLNINQAITAIDFTLASYRRRAENSHGAV